MCHQRTSVISLSAFNDEMAFRALPTTCRLRNSRTFISRLNNYRLFLSPTEESYRLLLFTSFRCIKSDGLIVDQRNDVSSRLVDESDAMLTRLDSFLMTTRWWSVSSKPSFVQNAFYQLAVVNETSFGERETNKFWQNVGAKTSKKNRRSGMRSKHKGHEKYLIDLY